MRLLGVFERESVEYLLLQDKNIFFIEETSKINQTFKNYDLLKNRDRFIGNEEVEGEGVFDFRYGPVMGGVLDAGVFHIHTHGERILSVSIDPSYKRRNLEQLMVSKTVNEAKKLSESVCGNFAFSHSSAFLRAVEDAGSIIIDETTKRIRIVALELERIYNHILVFARLSKGASQNVLTSHLEFLFEEMLRINRIFSKSRFLKNLNDTFIDKNGFDKESLEEVSKRIKNVQIKFKELYEHSLQSWNFVDRIYKTAILKPSIAKEIGITGPTLRACGYSEDLRAYEKLYDGFHTRTQDNSDALSRMIVRALEVIDSCDIVVKNIELIQSLKQEKTLKTHAISGIGLGYSESPSGLIVYFVEVKNDVINNVYISTPSVFGFKAFAESFAGYIFTDFSFSFDSFGINFADCAR